MSARPSVGSAYTRSAILAWANSILGASHLTFQDVPCHDVALLLYGIFHAHQHDDDVTSALVDATVAGAVVPVLPVEALRLHDPQHTATCMRFLQLLQFPVPHTPPNVTATSTADERTATTTVVTPAATASTGMVTQQHNAEHVLAMIRALSAEEAELLRTAPNTSPSPSGQKATAAVEAETELQQQQRQAAGGTAANVVLVLGPSMTPTAWLSGSAFVEELKLWRWVRLMADRHRRTVASIRAAIADYLQHDGTAAETAAEEGEGDAVLSDRRQQPPRPRTPSPVQADMSGSANADDDTVGEDGGRASKRVRAEPSLSPVPAGVAASPSTSLRMLPPHGSVSPVHALLSPIRDADRHAAAAAGGANARSDVSSAAQRSFQEATEATTTAYVAQSRPLQQALEEAEAALQQTLRAAHHAAATEGRTSTSARSSTGAAAATGRTQLLPAVVNGSEGLDKSCRQRMTARVFDADAQEGGAEGQDHATSPRVAPSCAVCPALMAHAVQCNLNALDALREVRAKAIAACVKKDPVALLAALQSVV